MIFNTCLGSSCRIISSKQSLFIRNCLVVVRCQKLVDETLWFVPQSRRMSDIKSNGSDHLQRTAENSRRELIALAKVAVIEDISPTVKQLTLNIAKDVTPQFSFKAGQWVDFFIPNVDTVGGYSMCSSPQLLKEKSQLQLAVKYSTHPPAHWVHTQCRVGSEVSMRVGGDFYYDPLTVATPSHLLLIAGGVGINPLLSMILHIRDLKQGPNSPSLPEKTTLLYTAQNTQELIFMDTIQSLENQNGFSIRVNTTQEKQPQSSSVLDGRITMETLRGVLKSGSNQDDTDLSRVVCYICGPGAMIDSMEDYLINIGLNKSQIVYEKWW